jgi:cold shock CspA family protein
LDGDELKRNQWVSFCESAHNGKPRAVQIVPIDCPPEYQCHGVISRFYEDRKFGFIKYEKGEIFFHINDVLFDGAEYSPVKGCTADFHIGQKSNKDLAVNVAIVEWPPEYKGIFSSEPQPEPAPVVEPQSELLKPESRKKTLLQLMQERKRV